MDIVITYHPEVAHDIKKIDGATRKRIQKSIEQKLAQNPLLYGEPLRGQLVPLWKLRVGDFRIVYDITKTFVHVHAIAHRSAIYKRVMRTRV